MTTEARITGLAKKLVSENLLLQSEAEQSFDLARSEKIPFVRHLVKNRILSSSVIAKAASEEFGLPVFDINTLNPNVIPMAEVDSKLIRKHHVLPLLKRGNVLFLAISDPSDVNAINDIKFHTGHSVEIIVVEDDKLNASIESLLDSVDDSMEHLADLEDFGLEDIHVEVLEDTRDEDDSNEDHLDDTPVVRFVNKILVDAIKNSTSDIHIEPYEKTYRIRFRQDGILREIASPPLNIANRICSRVKIMAHMDISEKRIPQDGRIKLKLSQTRSVDFRVNTLPTLWGEKIVLRLLDPSNVKMGIDALGFEPDQKQLFVSTLNEHQGMILVTGPTGSGKTVTLYTGLNILNTHERNISTAEDPVEINLEGINQVSINNRVGLDFSSALRAFLRQDPDVILVGEIRDQETAEIAIKASQTGHLVLSTLHTNSAPESLTRLRNMGVPSYNVATSVKLIIAQRLLRILCKNCKKPLKLPPKVLLQEGFTEKQLQNLQLYGAVGCDKCLNGYKGRVGFYEVVPITDEISKAIMDNGSSSRIAELAREQGFNDLRTSALEKVAQGITSLAEANRVS